MIFRLHRNYDPQTYERGIEAVSIHLGRLVTDIRWQSAADGITPYWNLCIGWRTNLGWKTLCNWTLYDGDKS